MANSLKKTALRSSFLPLPEDLVVAVQGKLAENLRRLECYRQSRQIFVDPSLLLRQTRVNVLLDGKELIMPSAGLKDGFYLLKPFSIPFKSLVMGVTYNGLQRYGRRLDYGEISALAIDLFIGETYAVDRQGNRLGDGAGFFDLAIAILAELGGMAPKSRIVAAIDDIAKITEDLPVESWDCKCAMILEPNGVEVLADSSPVPGIFWDAIAMERIKRISPLRHLHGQR